MKPWEEIDQSLLTLYNPCDYQVANYGLVRLSTDGEGNSHLIKDSDPELTHVNFDLTKDVQWFHILNNQVNTPGVFGGFVSQTYEIVWAEKANLYRCPEHDPMISYPHSTQGPTYTGMSYARRWLLTNEQLPNEWRFGVTYYNFTKLTNYA